MGLKNLIFFLILIKCVLTASNTDKSQNLSKKNFDSIEDLVKEALIEGIKAEIFDNESNAASKEKENKTKSEMISESRLEGSWLDMEGESPSLSENTNENDVLNSRESIDFNKRDDYFESLEKKSQRSTFISPPRKNFYTTFEDIDTSASEEYYDKEKPNNRKPIKIEVHTDDFDSKKEDSLSDVIHAASHPYLDALRMASNPRNSHQRRAIEVPPWRYTEDKPRPQPLGPQRPQPPAPRKHLPPVVDPPIFIEDDSPEQPQEPLLPRAAVHSHRSTFKSMPRMPAPIHIPQMNFNADSKFKPLPRSKPWASDFKKDSITPKFAMYDDNSFSTPRSFGKPVRQQFHEQGMMGPHSYKFGYSTGDLENPMARYEERGADGVVRGSYSYIDPRGMKQVVNYESHPKFGFKAKSSVNF